MTDGRRDDEIILSELPDDELVLQMHDDLYDGLRDEVVEGVNILLGRGWTPYDVLTKALVEGMRIVGIDFRDGILFVPEVLLAANSMKAGMAILKPLLAETGAPKLGKMVIGTVKGDIHDIGKNLVSMMMEGAGFEVVDLGINNPVEKYLEALEREDADILGMSALLTTTMPYMKVVIDTLKEKGLRDRYIVMVGGAPLNEEFGRAIGADAYCRDAAVAVETAKDFIARKHNQMAPRLSDGLPRSACSGRTIWPLMKEAGPDVFDGPVLSEQALHFFADPRHHLVGSDRRRAARRLRFGGPSACTPTSRRNSSSCEVGVAERPARRRGVGRGARDEACWRSGGRCGCAVAWVATEVGERTRRRRSTARPAACRTRTPAIVFTFALAAPGADAR